MFGILTSGGQSNVQLRETLGLNGEGEGPTQGFFAWLDKGLTPKAAPTYASARALATLAMTLLLWLLGNCC